MSDGKAIFDKARSLLGKRVKVTIRKDIGDISSQGIKVVEDAVIVVGILLGLGDGGDFEILEEDGFTHFCWPLLDIEEEDWNTTRG